MSDPTSRVLQLLSLLQTHKFWPGTELACRLDVSSRTLRRDVDRLRELGYPVEATPGVAGGYRLGAGAHMPPLLLDDDEAVVIAVGLRSAASASIAGVEETSIRALAKLEQVLPDRLRRRVSAVHSNVVAMRWGNDDTAVDAEALAVLALACRDHEQARFDYQRRDGEQMRRLVEPHNLVSAGRRWYLVAWDVRRDDWRTFRVDRMTSPQLAGVRFTKRDLPAADAAAFVGESLNAMTPAHRVGLVVHAPADVVCTVLRHPDNEVVDLDGSRSHAWVGSDDLDWLAVTIARLTVRFEVELDADPPPELAATLALISSRLAGATAP
ncbi:MAG: transcriptional regulator [Acidimicrobiia bacterium]|nr:transcriptional regulator [Acidimicrobiia bacterium]